MHQWTCGVDDTLWIDGYQVQVIEVTDEEVKLGVALPVEKGRLHEIRLPAAPGAGEPSSSSPSAVNEARSV